MSVQRSVLCALFLLAAAGSSFGQGLQVGTLSGVVRSSDDLPLPGVTVTATSPELQGERMAVSDVNGVYSLRGLPPGTYRVAFEISGFQAVTQAAVPVRLGATAVVDATLAPAGVTETVTVTAAAPSPLASASTTRAYTKAEVDALPVGRRPQDIGELAPGVTTNVFNAGQLTLSGAFGYDNVFMVNGVDVNDNVQGSANNLFVEDAIQETSVLTHGISAEYGRFSGGVINLVTKSGGNTFSGSVRENLSNPAWVVETPLQQQARQENPSLLSRTHEGTFGGPVVRDRLWFFAAGRRETSNTAGTLAQNGPAYTRTDTNTRGEGKVTATIAPSQTLQASYIDNATTQANMSGLPASLLLDSRVLITRQLPNRLFAASYTGVVSSRLFTTLQYSQKVQRWANNGNSALDLANSPFRTMGATPGVPGSLFYNAPYFDATDPEQRNNRQLTGSVSYLAATKRFGSHELKAGAEHFVSVGIGGNSQSSTGYMFFTDYATANGAVARDADGHPIPRFIPGVTQVWNFLPVRGAEVQIRTGSIYLQDRWVVSPRLTLDLGTRLEMVRGSATGDITTVDTSTIVPRLAASWALDEGNQTVVYATYGHYAGKYGQVQFAVNTNVGRPSEVDRLYTGPAGQGRDFAPGFDLSNYTTVTYANFPTENVQVAGDISSPLTREYTLGLGRELGGRGYAKGTYAWRRASDFIEDFIDQTTGTVTIPLVGTVANRLYANTDDLRRDYQALILESRYRVLGRLTLDGHYTVQLENHGNFAGEASGQPGIPSVYGNYPEIFGPAADRLMPWGRLDNYQRHKLRVMATYGQPLGRFGSVDVAPLWRVNSGAVYSLTASMPVPATMRARNPGYPTADVNTATRQTVFFGERGSQELPGYGVLDLATSYHLPVWKTLTPWFKVEVYNLLNNQKMIAWDRTVSVNAAGPVDANGIPTEYVPGPRFGQPTNGAHYPAPYLGQNGGRALRMAFGVRF